MATRPQVVYQVRIDATIQWFYAYDPDSDTWIGVCPPLNLTAVGDTWMELQAAASESTALLFTDLFADGELEDFLRNHGWQPAAPLPPRGERVQFDIPLNVSRRSLPEMVPVGA